MLVKYGGKEAIALAGVGTVISPDLSPSVESTARRRIGKHCGVSWDLSPEGTRWSGWLQRFGLFLGRIVQPIRSARLWDLTGS